MKTSDRKTLKAPTTSAPRAKRATASTATVSTMTASVAGPSVTEIARRSYELFLARGGEHGHDVEDWLQAEAELRSH